MELEYLKSQLNPQQFEAVTHQSGPLLILAGAGSGKTRVLTYRIAHLIGHVNVNPQSILALTFTNKAAEELGHRVAGLLNINDSAKPWVGTFHSLGCYILRQTIQKIPPYNNNFSIYDYSQQISIVKEIAEELGIKNDKLNPSFVLSKISNCKNHHITPEDIINTYEYFPLRDEISRIFAVYEKKLQKLNAVDFDDLLLLSFKILAEQETFLRKYQERWQHVLIDEYQDTNTIQYRLATKLTEVHKNLCVVGDDDQSIYRWRGAEIGNILNFEKDFKNVKTIKLEQNYRSTKTILNASNHIILNNKERKNKKLWSNLQEGEKIQVYLAGTEITEANYIAKQIKYHRQKTNYSFNKYAIFYRTNAQSRVIEDSLRRETIPYIIIAGLKFYDRKEIKDILSYLRIIHNPSDDISFKRVINTPPRGIGKIALQQIADYCRKHRLNYFSALKRILADKEDISLCNKLRVFINLMEELFSLKETSTVSQLTKTLISQIDYLGYIQADPLNADNRKENIDEFVSAAVEFDEKPSGEKGLAKFLEQVSLVSDTDTYNDQGSVCLMTLHSSKGLEFPVVFIGGLEEGIFPHQLALDEQADIEEERRLFYVGMTRAMENLFLLHSAQRRLYGKILNNRPSRFLDELPFNLIEKHTDPTLESQIEVYDQKFKDRWTTDKPLFPQGKPGIPSSAVVAPKNPYQLGMPVSHPKWGKGKICGIEGSGEQMKITVDFFGSKKKLLAKIAGLSFLGNAK